MEYGKYYIEFIEELDFILQKYISSCLKINKNICSVKNISISKALINEFWPVLLHSYRDDYGQKRSKGISKEELRQSIYNDFFANLLPQEEDLVSLNMNREGLGIVNYLKSQSQINDIFFCLNRRQLDYFKPVLKRVMSCTFVFISEEIESDYTLLNNNITYAEYELYTCSDPLYENSFLQRISPKLFWLANFFLEIFSCLKVRNLIVLEGNHGEMELLSSICKLLGVRSICVQQGWPSVIHSRFRNMTYDVFCTWGKKFNTLWRKKNTYLEFKEIGYLYNVSENKNGLSITFFLQSPTIIIDQNHFNRVIDFIVYCALSYPQTNILVKEHPEHRLDNLTLDILAEYQNVRMVTYTSIEEVYSHSEISVSIFSSTLMESIVHDTIPFVLNFSPFEYLPNNLEKEGVGLTAFTYEEACHKMDLIQSNDKLKTQIKNNISKQKKAYFRDISKQAVSNLLTIINSI